MSTSGPSLRSLALEAGVSLTTVSFALRNSREVSAATRERLQKLARLRGYRPDPQLTKLMTHLRMRAPARPTANICGLTQQWMPQSADKGSFPAQLCVGLRQRAESLGYAFDLIDLDDYPRREQLERVLLNRGIEGLVLLPLREPTDLVHRLDWSKFSTVSLTSAILAPQFHTVLPQQFDNMIRACKALTRAGFRRIGMAMSREWDVRVNHRWTGAIAWQNQFGGTKAIAPLVDDDGPHLNADVFVRWLCRERPDAVVVEETFDPQLLKQSRQELPKNYHPTIVTMNWPGIGADCGIDQRPERIGVVAAELLSAMLSRGERGIPKLSNHTSVEGRWIADGLAKVVSGTGA